MDLVAPLLAAAQLLFPIWLPLWAERPLTSADLDAPATLTLSTAQVAKAREGLRVAAPAVRARILVGLRQAATTNPDAAPLLIEQLAAEKNPAVLATLLQQLGHLPPALTPRDSVAALLHHPAPAVAAAAVRLYARLPEATGERLRPLAKAAPPPVRLALWQAFAARPALAGQPLLLTGRTLAEPELQALALEGCLQTEFTPAVADWLKAAVAATAAPPLRRAAAAQLDHLTLAAATAAAEQLRRDPVAAIRLTLAESLGRRPDAAATRLLLQILADPDPAVQAAALAALRQHRPGTAADLQAVAARLAAPTAPVREAAEALLVAWKAAPGLKPALLATLAGDSPHARFHAIRVLAASQADDTREAIAAQLARPAEPPENLAAALLALSRLGRPGEFAAPILAQAAHASPRVRAAAAEALGRLRIPGSEPVLAQLAMADAEAPVRLAALVAMGHHPRPEFAQPLLECLKQTSPTSVRTAEERAAAAWAAARLQPAPRPLLDRLVVQCTQPVIQTPMGPQLDADIVLANAIFSLAAAARANPAAKPHFARVASFLHATAANPATNQPFFMTPILAEVLRQAEAHLHGTPLEPTPRPLANLTLPYQPLER